MLFFQSRNPFSSTSKMTFFLYSTIISNYINIKMLRNNLKIQVPNAIYEITHSRELTTISKKHQCINITTKLHYKMDGVVCQRVFSPHFRSNGKRGDSTSTNARVLARWNIQNLRSLFKIMKYRNRRRLHCIHDHTRFFQLATFVRDDLHFNSGFLIKTDIFARANNNLENTVAW